MTIVATDVSNRVQSAKLTIGKEVYDMSVFSDAGKVRSAIGLQDHSLTVSFLADMTAGNTYALLYAMWVLGTGTNIEFKVDATAADSATNPRFTCNYILPQLPIGGQHGSKLTFDVTFQSTGTMTFDVAA